MKMTVSWWWFLMFASLLVGAVGVGSMLYGLVILSTAISNVIWILWLVGGVFVAYLGFLMVMATFMSIPGSAK